MVHLVACTWWYLGSRYDSFDPTEATQSVDRSSWIFGYKEQPGESPLGAEDGSTPWWWQYFISFWWSLGRITGFSSPGEMFPGSISEIIWTACLFLIGFAASGYVDGILAGKVMTRDEAAIEAFANRRIVEDFLQTLELPDDLCQAIRATAGAAASMAQTRRAEDVSQRLPHPLRQRIARRLFLPCIEKAPAWQGCSNSFIVEVAVSFKVMQVSKGSVLASPGEPATRLMILYKGRVEFKDSQGSRICDTARRGEMVGDTPFVFDFKQVIGAVAAEDSKLLCLSKEDFHALCHLYPEDRMALQRGMFRALEEDWLDGNDSDSGKLGRPTLDRKETFAGSIAKTTVTKKSSSAMSSSAGSSHTGSQSSSSTLRSLITRLYSSELLMVREKAMHEQNEAKQAQISDMIDQAANGNMERLEMLLSKKELSVDECDYDQRTALHLAVCEGHLQAVTCLVETYGASLTVKDRFGHTPMDDAVREQRTEVARYLMAHGARYQVDADVACTLCAAGYENDLEMLELLLAVVGVDPNLADYDRRTALHLAAGEGHMEAVTFLTSLEGINLSPRDRLGHTPLDDAIRHRRNDVRKLLQLRGGEMGDQQVGITICTHSSTNEWDRLKELAESGVPMSEGDYDARTGLHLAASEGNLQAATYLLLEACVDPNPLDRFLMTPLDDAVRHGRRAIESLLREHGGLSGKDKDMQQEVERFRKWQEGERQRKGLTKLNREMRSTEVHVIAEGLRRFVDHATLEEDVHAYVTNAASVRRLLLLLLRQNAIEDDTSSKGDTRRNGQITRGYREMMLNQASAAMDIAAARLTVVFDAELLPWIAGLSKPEARLLRLYMPGLKPALQRVRDQLRARSDLARALSKLNGDHHQRGYRCLPLGLLLHRLTDRSMRAVCRARVDAATMLWMCRQPAPVEPEASSPKKRFQLEAQQEKGPSPAVVAAAAASAAAAKHLASRPLKASAALELMLGGPAKLKTHVEPPRRVVPPKAS